MATNPTTGLYDLTGGDTSATATQGINDNFTTLWERDEWAEGEINSLEGRPYVVSQGTQRATIQGESDEAIWYYQIWSDGFFEAWTYFNKSINPNAKPPVGVAGQYIYETPIINYPAVITNLGLNFRPLEFATFQCGVSATFGTARTTGDGTSGFNTQTHSAQYCLARGNWNNISTFDYTLCLHIVPRTNEPHN